MITLKLLLILYFIGYIFEQLFLLKEKMYIYSLMHNIITLLPFSIIFLFDVNIILPKIYLVIIFLILFLPKLYFYLKSDIKQFYFKFYYLKNDNIYLVISNWYDVALLLFILKHIL